MEGAATVVEEAHAEFALDGEELIDAEDIANDWPPDCGELEEAMLL